MAYKVSGEAILKTVKCPYNFDCLEDAGVPRCLVEGMIGESRLWVGNHGKKSGPYTISFGAKRVCFCPVRVEIYSSYGE